MRSSPLLLASALVFVVGCASGTSWSPTADEYGDSRAQYLTYDLGECQHLSGAATGHARRGLMGAVPGGAVAVSAGRAVRGDGAAGRALRSVRGGGGGGESGETGAGDPTGSSRSMGDTASGALSSARQSASGAFDSARQSAADMTAGDVGGFAAGRLSRSVFGGGLSGAAAGAAVGAAVGHAVEDSPEGGGDGDAEDSGPSFTECMRRRGHQVSDGLASNEGAR